MKSTKAFKIIFLICLTGLIFSCLNKSQKNIPSDSNVSSGIMTDSISDNLVNDEDDYEEISYDMIDNWMTFGIDQKTVIEKLGEPEEKGEDIFWGALETYVQKWNYNSKGISFEMESETQNGNKHVLMITLNSPSTGKTSKLISIGSKKEDVLKAYEGRINSEFSDDKQIVVGSIYGGVIFTFENNIVTRIFIGAAAE